MGRHVNKLHDGIEIPFCSEIFPKLEIDKLGACRDESADPAIIVCCCQEIRLGLVVRAPSIEAVRSISGRLLADEHVLAYFA